MKNFIPVLLISLCGICSSLSAQIPQKISSFDVSQVRLTASPFEHAQQMDIRYLLALDPDRLLAPYLKGAGLPPKAENYTNWENTGLDGHIGGHYLSALSYMYAATGNAEIKARLDYMIAELKRCQDEAGDGFLCGAPQGRKLWEDIAAGHIKAGAFSLNNGWVPLYNIHKIYAGLRDAYLQTGIKEAREMLIDLTDWMIGITENLTDSQMQQMLVSEHGGLNETFADVAAITGEEKYLVLAKRFSHQRLLDPLLKQEDKLTGMHANTQIPKVIGYKRIADLEGNGEWADAARFFWQTVTEHRSISIGGNSVREHFHPAHDFSSMMESEQGPETCNTYNMLRLAKMLYQTDGDVKYMDYYERALYNHILSTINPVQGGFVYFTPMRSGHYRVYSQPQTSFWCCVGSGMENHARYGEMIYAHQGDDMLYVNLFIPSVLQWGKVQIEQQTAFPESDVTRLIVSPRKPAEFALMVRIPEWTDAGHVSVSVNQQAQSVEVRDGYACVKRKWHKGDRVEVTLPMHLRVEALPDQSPNYSFLYGPVVLAADMGKQEQLGLFADDSRGGHIAAGRQIPLSEMPVLVSDPDSLVARLRPIQGKPLTFELSGLYPQKKQVLVPFYSLHECRYMVYWRVMSEQQKETYVAELAQKEKERMALELATVDKVICGEQQPESDHFIRMDKSRTGDENGTHWRAAEKGGSFTYTMRLHGRQPELLRVTYLAVRNADVSIRINGKEVGVITAEKSRGTHTCQIEMPVELRQEKTIEVSFQSLKHSNTHRLMEVRLVAGQVAGDGENIHPIP